MEIGNDMKCEVMKFALPGPLLYAVFQERNSAKRGGRRKQVDYYDSQQIDETSRSSHTAVVLSSDSDSDDFRSSRPSTSKSRANDHNSIAKQSNKSNINKLSNILKRTSSSSSIGQEKRFISEGSVLRLKVRILEHTMLVPVSEDDKHRTIDWLVQKCSARYFKTYGVKPILTLNTKDGALLSGSDTISLVLGGNETELVASVSEFDLPPLTDRFKTACAELEIFSTY